MEYYFYLGNSEEREKLISAHDETGDYPYQEKVTRLYTTFREREVEVVRSLGRWLVLDAYDSALLRYLNCNPTLRRVEVVEDKQWDPVAYTDQDTWSCFMVDNKTIVGYYMGSLDKDSLGRMYSRGSFAGIRPDYRGKGLCRELVRFAYDSLIKVAGVDYIITEVDSNIGAGASRAYMRAAKDLGLLTYGYCSEEEDDDYALREVEDCDKGKSRFSLPSYLDHLIFSSHELDDVMRKSSL
ncbi:Acyl-CoA N-acetyltransferase [Cedratvirus Zaza IHUMI]|uniref:Acyl-CoA N-acetyltransferase n=1 Tax=Cedratvirus Zaza IHUMI TaxID=2126979 RepID=A0A2R8FDJ0_9VIRU|nr:Acyl-CoA N-acetyltransferase [Cedratvirus Zaza IHUMI]